MFNFEYNIDMRRFLVDTKDLLHKHWEELALNKEKVPLSPDDDRLVSLQRTGILKSITVYNNANIAVGYSVLFIQPHVHYSTTTMAHVDIIYVDPEYRSTSLGARLLLATEQLAKDNGAQVITHHAKPYAPMIIKPLEKLGYSLYEHIYGKYVGE